MAVKKSELYSSLWKSCDQLRGGMDASQYKDYVLVLLFVKYVSDKYAGRDDSVIVVPEGGSFQDMVALKGSKDIGEEMNKIVAKLAEANDLVGVINVADFNDKEKLGSGKEQQDRLTALVGIFQEPGLDFSRNRADGDDILGDAYEYLMQHFATESGKSKGQFYTPAEVSRVMAKVIGIEHATSSDQTVYDPTCGSGSLLLKAADEAPVELSLYGQEMDNATYALARMNMILHGYNTAELAKGNTLAEPKFKDTTGQLKTHDFVVANPPFSVKAWSNGVNVAHDPYHRFTGYGVPPVKNGDYAFLLHIVRSLSGKGKGAVVLPHGVLFRGNVEANIRRNLVLKGYLKGIIGLPPNLFYGTGIPACLLVLDKAEASERTGIFMVDASRGYMKDGNKNRLREQDIHKIVDVFGALRDEPGYARMVSLEEIARNDYNLNLPRYLDGQQREDQQDLDAHLRGGIPEADVVALAPHWAVYPGLRDALLGPGDRAGYLTLRVGAEDVRRTVFEHPEFRAFQDKVEATYTEWATRARATLLTLAPDTKSKKLLPVLAEDLLHTLAEVALLDRYDVYQRLMDYWATTMQDDVYEVVAEGWKARARAGRKGHWNSELAPRELVIRRYLANEQGQVEAATAALEEAARERETLEEEYGAEDAVLAGVAKEGKLAKADVARRLRELLAQGAATDQPAARRGRKPKAASNGPLFGEAEAEVAVATGADETDAATPAVDPEEVAALQAYTAALAAEDKAKDNLKKAEQKLEVALGARYEALTEADVQVLVVDDKWLATMHQGLHDEMARLSGTLARRLTELAERYATPLPELDAQVATLSETVNGYLRTLGFSLN